MRTKVTWFSRSLMRPQSKPVTRVQQAPQHVAVKLEAAEVPTLYIQTFKRTYDSWAKLAWEIRSYVISVTSKFEDLASIETRLNNLIDMISVQLDPKVAEKYYALLRRVVWATLALVKATMTSQDVTTLRKECVDSIMEMAKFMHELNPDVWSVAQVVDAFSRVAGAYELQATSRINKAWMHGVYAADQAYTILTDTVAQTFVDNSTTS